MIELTELKSSLLIFLLICSLNGRTQVAEPLAVKDSMPHYESKIIPVFDADYLKKYKNARRLVLEVYAYALYAADLISTMENDGAAIEKRRKRNKFYSQSYQLLKEDFRYVILDMYTDEGQMLMKLVHRESGMTVYEAAEKYRGKANAEFFSLMGKLFDQDIQAEYDSLGADKITENVIRDLQAGLIPFENEVKLITRDDYKKMEESRKERAELAKKRRKEMLKKKKEKEKLKKKKEKEQKRARQKSENSGVTASDD